MANRSGDFYAQVSCPSCRGAGKRWLVDCSRCRGSGSILARCVRCACGALVGALDPDTGEDLFRTDGVDLPTTSGRDCPRCRRLRYEPSFDRGHLRYDPPADRRPHC